MNFDKVQPYFCITHALYAIADLLLELAELLSKHTFQLKRLQSEADALYIRFLEKPYDVLNQPYEVEVINYEKSWIHICNFMKGIYKAQCAN